MYLTLGWLDWLGDGFSQLVIPRLADENDERINFRNDTGALDRHP